MPGIADYVTAVTAINTGLGTDLDSLTNEINGFKTQITALNATITQLQNSTGSITPADQALLDTAQAQAAALKTKADALVVPVVPPPPPPPKP